MTDYKTEAEQANPRVCVQFSENLARGQVDFAKFVSVDGKDPQGLVAESQQLCFEGLTHGQRYEVTIRAGLPSDVNETLLKPVHARRLRSRPQAVRALHGQELRAAEPRPAGHPGRHPSTRTRWPSKSTASATATLPRELDNDNLDNQLSSYDITEIKERKGTNVYEGELEVVSKLNQEVTTALPVNEAVGDLKPGAYAVIARPASLSPATTATASPRSGSSSRISA